MGNTCNNLLVWEITEITTWQKNAKKHPQQSPTGWQDAEVNRRSEIIFFNSWRLERQQRVHKHKEQIQTSGLENLGLHKLQLNSTALWLIKNVKDALNDHFCYQQLSAAHVGSTETSPTQADEATSLWDSQLLPRPSPERTLGLRCSEAVLAFHLTLSNSTCILNTMCICLKMLHGRALSIVLPIHAEVVMCLCALTSRSIAVEVFSCVNLGWSRVAFSTRTFKHALTEIITYANKDTRILNPPKRFKEAQYTLDSGRTRHVLNLGSTWAQRGLQAWYPLC